MVSTQSGYPGAPPGWYPDPAGGPGQRWWDGYAWTESTVLPEAPPPPPWANAGPPVGPPTTPAPWAVAAERLETYNTSSLVDAELSMAPLTRIAFLIPAIWYVATLISNRINAAALLSIGDQFRVDVRDAQNGIAAPAYHTTNSGTFSPLVLIIGLAAVAAVVVGCIWQHRAASAARALGLPSKVSPAWGVGSWFVPVVNLWVPYTAIRDCLPPDHPVRPQVLRWWLAFVCAATLTMVAWWVALFSSGAALAVSVPALLACLAMLAWAPGIVMAVAASHREAMDRSHAGVLPG